MALLELAEYELTDVIGAGGMATVFRARSRRSGQNVAVKILTSELARREHFRSAFREEVRSAARLSHPGLVRLLDAGHVPAGAKDRSGLGISPGSPYLVMEEVRGGTLDSHIRGLDWWALRDIALQLLDALAHAHALGIIHRDVKPANVLMVGMSRGPRVKLADFGIARLYGWERDSAAANPDGKITGTPKYMAPECVLGQWRDQGPWTDLYSLGIMMWKLAAGEPPFTGVTTEVLSGHLEGALPTFEPRMAVPPRLDAWLRTALEKSPQKRFRRAADARAALLTLGDPTAPVFVPAHPTVSPDSEAEAEEPMLTFPTVTGLVERSSGHAWYPERQFGTLYSWDRPVTPRDWRTSVGPKATGPADSDLGLGLFGLRVPPITGLHAQRDMLWQCLLQVCETGQAHVALVHGPAGCGKTRLVQWLTRRAHEVGAASLLQALHAPDGGSRDTLGRMLEREFRCEGLPPDKVLERVRRVYGELTQGRDTFADHDSLAIAEMVVTRGGQQEERFVRFSKAAERHFAVRRVLMNLAADRPLVVWIEDAHWADDSLELVRFFAAHPESAPVLFVLAGRDAGEYLRGLHDLGRVTDVAVDRQSDVVIGDLVDALLPLRPEIAQDVASRADGIPLFAVQLVGDWVERGLLRPTESGFTVGLDTDSGPSDVENLLHQRLTHAVRNAGLDREEGLRWLTIGALLGRHVDLREWQAATGAPPEDLRELVEALAEMGLVEVKRATWAFSQVSTWDSLHAAARADARWVRHNESCAEAIGQTRDVGYAPHTIRFARHLSEAGRPVDALDALLRVMKDCKRANQHELLQRLLDHAAPLADAAGLPDEDPRRDELDVARIALFNTHHELRRGEELAERLIERAVALSRPRLEVEACFQRGNNALAAGETDRAIELYRRGLTIVRAIGDGPREIAICHAGLGNALLHQGRFREALPHIEEARELFGVAGEMRPLAFNYFQGGVVARYEGDTVEARRWYERSAELASRMGFRDMLPHALNALGDLDRAEANWASAGQRYREALDLWASTGDPARHIAAMNLGMVAVERSQWERALRIFEPLQERLEREGAALQLTFAYALALPCYAGLGDAERFDGACARVRKLRAAGRVDDPDLGNAANIAAREWESRGDRVRADQARTVLAAR